MTLELDLGASFHRDNKGDNFVADPGRFTQTGTQRAVKETGVAVVYPMCAMTIDPDHAAAHRAAGGVDYWFCGPGCAERFDEQAATRGPP